MGGRRRLLQQAGKLSELAIPPGGGHGVHLPHIDTPLEIPLALLGDRAESPLFALGGNSQALTLDRTHPLTSLARRPFCGQ